MEMYDAFSIISIEGHKNIFLPLLLYVRTYVNRQMKQYHEEFQTMSMVSNFGSLNVLGKLTPSITRFYSTVDIFALP